jgi:hypothetical protein
LVRSSSQAPVSPGEAFNRSNSFGAGNGIGEFLVAFAGGAATYLAGEVEGLQRIVELPMLTIPDQPFLSRRIAVCRRNVP